MSAAATPLADSEHVLLRRIVARVIDDGIVLALAAALIGAAGTVIEANSRATNGVVIQLPGGYFDGPPPGEVDLVALAALVATVGLVFLGAFAYYAGVSAAHGRSAGRAAMGLQVVRTDGAPARWPLLLGRELVRISLLALAVALLWPLRDALSAALTELGPRPTLDQILQWTPLAFVIAGWAGATLADPLQRAPHDRLVGTRVVGAPPRGSTAEETR